MTLLHQSQAEDTGQHSGKFISVLRRLHAGGTTRWWLERIEWKPVFAHINDVDAEGISETGFAIVCLEIEDANRKTGFARGIDKHADGLRLARPGVTSH